MKPGTLWPLSLGAVLAFTVVANVAVIYRASDTDAVAVEPDYYRKAVTWDSAMSQAERNARLGWRISGTLAKGGSVEVTLSDRDGTALTGASVEVEGYALARAGTMFHFELAGTSGLYRGQLPEASGLHELRFTVTMGRERFTAVRRAAPGQSLRPRT